MMPNPFVCLAALLPLVGYLIVLATIRLSGRPLVTTGGRDLAAVLIAISGLVLVGPLELFFPRTSAALLGVWVWLPLAALYGLGTLLAMLSSRPRLVVYGREPDELFPALVRAAQSMDPAAEGVESKWQVRLPGVDAHLRIDGASGYDCCSVESFEPSLPAMFWNRLLSQVRTELPQTSPPTRRRGWGMLAAAIALLAIITRHALANQDQLVQGFRDWLVR